MSNEKTILKQKRERDFPRIKKNEKQVDENVDTDSLSDQLEEDKDTFKKILEKDFIYSTPAPNKKRKLFQPPTPQKNKMSSEFDKIKIKGKNLLELFESL